MHRTPPPPVQPPDPILVEATRGPLVESLHRGAAAVCDATGALVAAWGDVYRGIYPRSSVKPLQALPLIETGAADRFSLTERDLALACASHGGEPMHLEVLSAWLGKIGLTVGDLECGAHAPTHAETALALAKRGEVPTAAHNNCSGKHCGMLTTALHMGEPTRGYIDFHHPIQQRIAQALGEMTGCAPEHTPHGIDGCGIPTFALPLAAVAAAMAKMADPRLLGPVRANAAERLCHAISHYPELVAGSGRLCTRIMQTAPSVVVKGGAEGFYIAILPAKGLGVALKIGDGASRASEVAILALLRHLGALSASEEAALQDYGNPALRNVAGRPVGHLRPAPSWLKD